MARTFAINIPGLSVTWRYDFDARHWQVLPSTTDAIEGFLTTNVVTCQELSYMLGDIETAYFFLSRKLNKVDKKLQPSETWQASWADYHDPCRLGSNPTQRCQFTSWGHEFWYTEDERLQVDEPLLCGYVEEVLRFAPKIDPLLIGALEGNFSCTQHLYLVANKLGTVVHWDSDSEEWAESNNIPAIIPTLTTLGVTAYISDESVHNLKTLLALGYDYLARICMVDYPIEMLADVPEYMYEVPAPSNVVEQAIQLDTNQRRLLYFLNTDINLTPAEITEQEEIKEVVIEKPVVSFQTSQRNWRTIIQCGGAVQVTDGFGSYPMHIVLEVLKESAEHYKFLYSDYDDSGVSEIGMHRFQEKFGIYRVSHEPGPTDSALPIQLSDGVYRWTWTGDRWAPVYGDAPDLPDSTQGPYGLTFHYVDKMVDMNSTCWEQLVSSLISTFQLADKGLATLYYNGNEMPKDMKEIPELNASITISDPLTGTHYTYGWDGTWEQCSPNELVDPMQTESGFIISLCGSGHIMGDRLAQLVASVDEVFFALCEVRAADKDMLASKTIYGDWDTLLMCNPIAQVIPSSNVKDHLLDAPDAPIALYINNKRLSHTKYGWSVNNLAKDTTIKVTDKVGYEAGHVDIATVPTLIKDYLPLISDETKEEVLITYEIAAAQL